MLNTAHPDSIRTIKSDEFLPQIQRWISLGGLLLMGVISISVILSATVKYNIAVKANATIRPVGELRLVQSMTEGSIKQIVVTENQEVKEGDAIAYLDDTKLQIQASQLQNSIQQSRLQLAQLDAQVRSMDSQILAESQLIDRVITAAEVEINRYQRGYDERQLTTQADFQETKVALESAQDELTRYQGLAGTGAISELQLKQKQSAVQTAEAKLNHTQAALNPSQASGRVAQEQVAQQQARGKATLASLNKERQALNQRRSEIQNQLIRAQKDLEQTVREIRKSVIRAPSNSAINS
nr:biotin/lipoyl-binding protein [Phormidesmis priestleyi]